MWQNLCRSTSLLAGFIALGSLILLGGNAFSVNRFGDVLIQNDGETFQCDNIVCPKGSLSCQVTKFPDQEDPNLTLRRNICYSRDGAILLEDSRKERNVIGQTQRLNVVVSQDGYSSSSSVMSSMYGQNYNDSAVIDSEVLQQTFQQVQQTLDRVNQELKETLGGLWKGF